MNIIKYDPEMDAAYLKIQDGEYVESEEISDGVILDYDKNDNVIAVEFLGASTLSPSHWQKLQSQLPTIAYRQLQTFFANSITSNGTIKSITIESTWSQPCDRDTTKSHKWDSSTR